MKETLKSGKQWKGQIKKITKDNNPYYVTVTSFPLYENDDNELSGYITIRFLVTDLVKEKREFKKNVVSNLLDYKKKNNLIQLKKSIFFRKKI